MTSTYMGAWYRNQDYEGRSPGAVISACLCNLTKVALTTTPLGGSLRVNRFWGGQPQMKIGILSDVTHMILIIDIYCNSKYYVLQRIYGTDGEVDLYWREFGKYFSELLF